MFKMPKVSLTGLQVLVGLGAGFLWSRLMGFFQSNHQEEGMPPENPRSLTDDCLYSLASLGLCTVCIISSNAATKFRNYFTNSNPPNENPQAAIRHSPFNTRLTPHNHTN